MLGKSAWTVASGYCLVDSACGCWNKRDRQRTVVPLVCLSPRRTKPAFSM